MTRMMMAAGGGGATEDADAAAAMAAFTTPPTAGRRTLINDLVVGLKADGIWSTLDWLVLLAAETEQAGRVNLKTPAKTLTAVNLPTFVTNTGFKGNGINANLTINEPWSNGGNFIQNSAQLTVAVSQFPTDSQNLIGDASARSALIAWSNQYRINQYSHSIWNGPASVELNTPLAVATCVRTGAAATAAYVNGVLRHSDTVASADPGTSHGRVLSDNVFYTTATVAVIASGAGLNATQVAALHSSINAYRGAVGAN